MQKTPLFLILCLFIGGCSSSTEPGEAIASETATKPATLSYTETIIPTETATLTETLSPVPISALDLGSLVYQDGDLPAQFTPIDMMRINTSLDLGTVSTPDNRAEANFNITGTDDAIRTVVFVYEVVENTQEASRVLSAGKTPLAGIGEQAYTATQTFPEDTNTTYLSEIAFVRCHAVAALVFVSLNWSNPSLLIEYAERLDGRLSEAVCR